MNVVLVSNWQDQLCTLRELCRAVFCECSVVEFTDPMLSAKYIWDNAVDIVLADAAMRPANGLQLLKVLRSQKAELPVVILSEADTQRTLASDLAADAYLIKPVTKSQLKELTKFVTN